MKKALRDMGILFAAAVLCGLAVAAAKYGAGVRELSFIGVACAAVGIGIGIVALWDSFTPKGGT